MLAAPEAQRARTTEVPAASRRLAVPLAGTPRRNCQLSHQPTWSQLGPTSLCARIILSAHRNQGGDSLKNNFRVTIKNNVYRVERIQLQRSAAVRRSYGAVCADGSKLRVTTALAWSGKSRTNAMSVLFTMILPRVLTNMQQQLCHFPPPSDHAA